MISLPMNYSHYLKKIVSIGELRRGSRFYLLAEKFQDYICKIRY